MIDPPEQFLRDCQTIGVALDERVLHRLGRFLAGLLETNRQFNLTAIRDPDEAWRRHILESVALMPLLDHGRRVADVGSGGGLPGLALAIARPDLNLTLIEATGKKARFLATVKSQLGLTNVEVVNDRAETVGQLKMYREHFDIALARAVGPMRVLLELTLPLVNVGGHLLAMKGAQAEQELEQAGDAIMTLGGGALQVVELLPGLDDEAVVVVIDKATATPKPYPRLPGMPKQQPL